MNSHPDIDIENGKHILGELADLMGEISPPDGDDFPDLLAAAKADPDKYTYRLVNYKIIIDQIIAKIDPDYFG